MSRIKFLYQINLKVVFNTWLDTDNETYNHWY